MKVDQGFVLPPKFIKQVLRLGIFFRGVPHQFWDQGEYFPNVWHKI